MKVCFIGACGHWGQALNCLRLRQDVEFCGFAPGSIHEERFTSIDPGIPYFDDYEKMLEITRPDLAIVSPVFGYTGRVILACAKRGVDVFSEKPVAASREELEAVRSAILQSDIRFCAMHYLRYAPAFFHGARMVREGRIGSLKMLTAQKSYKFGRRPDWYRDSALYCGTIPWVGIHAIDWISYYSGRRFVSVAAQSVGRDPEMAALCQFTLEGGLIASANIDFYRPQTAGTHGDDRIRCVGTEGVLEVCGDKISLMNQDGVFEYHPKEAPELLTEFLNGGLYPETEEIFHLTRVAIAAKEAADTNKTVIIGG